VGNSTISRCRQFHTNTLGLFQGCRLVVTSGSRKAEIVLARLLVKVWTISWPGVISDIGGCHCWKRSMPGMALVGLTLPLPDKWDGREWVR